MRAQNPLAMFERWKFSFHDQFSFAMFRLLCDSSGDGNAATESLSLHMPQPSGRIAYGC